MRAYHLGLKVRCFLILVQWIKAYVPCERRVYTGHSVFLEIKASQIATAHRIGLLYSLVVE
jgi:hypothetical protein